MSPQATGRLLFNMLGAIAQFETEIRAERQMVGIQKAKQHGVHFGRRKTLTRQQTSELQQRREQGELIKTLMKDYGLSKSSVYRYLDEAKPTAQQRATNGAPHQARRQQQNTHHATEPETRSRLDLMIEPVRGGDGI